MKRLLTILFTFSSLFALFASLHAGAEVISPYDIGQMLMVDENGEISPKGYTLGLDELARAQATQAVVQASVDAVKAAQDAASKEVDQIVDVLLGDNAYAYVNDFIESLGAVKAVDTNATCQIIKFDVGTVRETIDGVSYSRCDLYYSFSDEMNNTPYVVMMPTLDGYETNEWTRIELQNTDYLGTYTLDGVTWENAYRSYVWTLTELEKCFYRVNCKISAASGDGSTFDIQGAIRINGETGDTATFTAVNYQGQTNDLVFVGGLLKEIKLHEEQAEEEGGSGE